MRSLIIFLINPFSWYFILLLISAYFFFRKDHRSILRTFILTLVIFLSSSTSFIPNMLVNSLENKSKILDAEKILKNKEYDILVLGTECSENKELPLNQQLPEKDLNRLIEGIRIQKELPGSILIVSTGSFNTDIDRSDVMLNVAIELGADTIVQIPVSKNMLSVSRAYAEYKKLNRKLILVTDAVLMPRAMADFNASGISPIPAPTNYLNKYQTKKNKSFWMPSAENVNRLNIALKEYLELIVVHFRT